MEYGVFIKDEDLEMRKPLGSAMSSDCMVSSEEGENAEGDEREDQNTPYNSGQRPVRS